MNTEPDVSQDSDEPQYEEMPQFIDTEAQAFWDARNRWIDEAELPIELS